MAMNDNSPKPNPNEESDTPNNLTPTRLAEATMMSPVASRKTMASTRGKYAIFWMKYGATTVMTKYGPTFATNTADVGTNVPAKISWAPDIINE